MTETIDNASGEIDPTPSKIRLKTLEDVRLAMASVYRDMRSGKIEMSDGTKLAYVLTSLAKVIEGSINEERTEILERILKERKISG